MIPDYHNDRKALSALRGRLSADIPSLAALHDEDIYPLVALESEISRAEAEGESAETILLGYLHDCMQDVKEAREKREAMISGRREVLRSCISELCSELSRFLSSASFRGKEHTHFSFFDDKSGKTIAEEALRHVNRFAVIADRFPKVSLLSPYRGERFLLLNAAVLLHELTASSEIFALRKEIEGHVEGIRETETDERKLLTVSDEILAVIREYQTSLLQLIDFSEESSPLLAEARSVGTLYKHAQACRMRLEILISDDPAI